jgi:hypothetical protein
MEGGCAAMAYKYGAAVRESGWQKNGDLLDLPNLEATGSSCGFDHAQAGVLPLPVFDVLQRAGGCAPAVAAQAKSCPPPRAPVPKCDRMGGWFSSKLTPGTGED